MNRDINNSNDCVNNEIDAETVQERTKITHDESLSIRKQEEMLEAKRKELEKLEKELNERKIELNSMAVRINKENMDLDERKQNFENELLDEQNKKRKKFLNEKEEERKKFDDEMKIRLSELDEELKKKRKSENEKLEKELNKKRAEQEEEFDRRTADFNKRTAEFDKREEELNNKEMSLAGQKRILEREKSRLKQKELNIKGDQDSLEEIINKKIDDRIKSYDRKMEAKDNELNRLRKELSSKISEIESFRSIQKAYGDDPQILRRLEEENRDLKEELANVAKRSEVNRLLEDCKHYKSEVDRLLDEKAKLYEPQKRINNLEAQNAVLTSDKKNLLATCEYLQNLLEGKNQELLRLSAPEGRVADRDARIAAIMTGSLDDGKDLIGAGVQYDSRSKSMDEITWLGNISSKCEQYGIRFNKRILYAFHTALKINEWSTITVLAGVSGTGKSELPRLYSEFGGLNFCSVAVQPNWDSQESMLGFFNSIDNQFEPEELLKFLVQCTVDEKYKDYMSLILLDEMNLAHVELYFAEFLSKLESRRGLSKKYLPEIEVKLGAGVKPYGLKLARTLLWTGTMNQDETTKSLSDKVLDRSIVINFPRPRRLENRPKMELITKIIGDNRPKMHKETWESWTSHELNFSEEQNKELDRYRMIVEDINNSLEKVGRALGHRVWQSIEYYIANYPTVRQAMNYKLYMNPAGKKIWMPQNSELTGELKEAMKCAFEDQIVQKIMPKLRGIETRDKRGKSSLDEIEDLLVKHDFAGLQEDFQIAREQGYGQFIWNSAKYLDEKDEKEEENKE